MIPTHSEPYAKFPSCELRVGIASWDDGSRTEHSIKLTSFDKNGKALRHGEVAIAALPQMLDFSIRTGYLKLY